MIYEYLSEGYFNTEPKRDSVSAEDTKKRVMHVQQSSAVSDFKSLITGGYPDLYIGIKDPVWSNEIIEVDGKFRTISVLDNYGEVQSADEIPDTLGYIFFRIVKSIIESAGENKGKDSLDVFMIDRSAVKPGNDFKKYTDNISQDLPNIIFKVDPSSLKGKLKTARFGDLLYVNNAVDHSIGDVSCSPFQADNVPFTSVSEIGQSRGISVEFLYTPVYMIYKSNRSIGSRYINWIECLAGAVHDVTEGSDEEYSDEFTDICRKAVHTEFEAAKSESRKPSFINTVILIADKFFKKSVRQTVKDLHDDLKVISDCLSDNQPMYEIEYGCRIPVKLTAKFRMFEPDFEAESQKILRNILGTGMFSESVNDFIGETGIAVFPSVQ